MNQIEVPRLSPKRPVDRKKGPSAALWRFLVAAGLSLGARDCRYYDSYVVYEFALSACPDSTFALVDKVRQGPHRLRLSNQPARDPVCPAFRVYEFVAENMFYQYNIFVSFERGPSCRMFVALLYDKHDPKRAPDYQKSAPALEKQFAELAEWAQTVARLSMGPHATQLSLTLVGYEPVGASETFQMWCTRARNITSVAPKNMPCST